MKFSHHAFIVSLFGLTLGAVPAAWAQDVTSNGAPVSSSQSANTAVPAAPAQTAVQGGTPATSAAPDATVSGAPVTPGVVQTIPGMPAVIDPKNIYSETVAGRISPAIKDDLARVYVPNLRGNSVSVIDPATFRVVDTFKVGRSPQHVVPSWDLRTLWVTNNAEGSNDGSLTPIDPRTGKPGTAVKVDDPYNMYFTPDGKYAIVVAEAHERLDFRDPHSMALIGSVEAPQCKGINHADFSIDGRYAIFTCEFGGYLAKIDTVNRSLVGYLKLSKGGMPQDILTAPDGHKFYIADMHADGVFVVDGDSFRETGFIPTGPGTHGEYPSRDGKFMYVANRGSHKIHGPRHSPGSVSVIDFATDKVVKTWPIPGGGSPDMGNVSADGKLLWLSGRFDDVAYAINTETGDVKKIPVGAEPHGLTVWPQPGRYSVGHTGILR
ncbi:YncE family protein [Asaia prunellae]|uniref:YncE family protein n=1 Tax=Asaia prunellae TaxID=610245 RepID=UPI000471404A|nr:YncE family protein [Asaia prunellae]